MQKTVVLLISISLILFSCTQKEKIENEKIKTVVSILPYKYFVERIGEDLVEVETLIPPGASPHSFELNPAQLKAIQNSDIYFKVGGPFKFEKILLTKFEIDTSKITLANCSQGLEIFNGDPHIWLSPDNVRKISGQIHHELTSRFPQKTSEFQTNYEEFISELDSIDRVIKYDFAKLASNKFMVYHGAWGYFARHYNLEQIPFEAEGKSLKAGDYKAAIALAKKFNVKVLFADPHYDSSPVRSVADELKIAMEFMDPLPADYLKNLEDIHLKFVKYLN